MSEDIGMEPFYVYLGWNPKYPFDFINVREFNIEYLIYFKEKMANELQEAAFPRQVANERKCAYAEMKTRSHL